MSRSIAVAYVVPLSSTVFILLIVSELCVKVTKSFRSFSDVSGESIKVVISSGESFKSDIPGGVNIPWIWVSCFFEETELEFQPAEMRFGAALCFSRNMSLIFFIREVLLPDAAFELIS